MLWGAALRTALFYTSLPSGGRAGLLWSFVGEREGQGVSS